ncbi:MAG: multiheme c-type cytochrome [Deltaproteobacteria bacterium]|nr:multiheme c-type cytochrome [Deltaproteobacteria bacterium]
MSPSKLLLLTVSVGVVVALLTSSSSTAAAQVAEHDYVGAERCKSCHLAEYAAWEQSPHAKAFAVLSTKEQADPRCQQCHTLVPNDTQQALAGVQCESCHGAGRHYMSEWVMRDAELASLLNLVAKVDATTCVRCHNDASPSLRPFDFATSRELIKHWKP